MTYEEWQKRRGTWMDEEKAERQSNWSGSRPHIAQSITERAIRELYDRLEALEKAFEKKAKA